MQDKDNSNKKNPNNPRNSTIVQGLCELLRLDGLSDAERQKIRDVHKMLINDKWDLAAEADKSVNRKHYADDKLTFVKQPNYNMASGLANIMTPPEYWVLSQLASIMSQDNLVRLSTRSLMDLTGYSKRAVQGHIGQLLNKGCLAIHTPAYPKSSIPRIYMINPDIYDCGKPSQYKIHNYYDLANINRKDFLSKLNPPDKDCQQGLIVLPNKQRAGIMSPVTITDMTTKKRTSSKSSQRNSGTAKKQAPIDIIDPYNPDITTDIDNVIPVEMKKDTVHR